MNKLIKRYSTKMFIFIWRFQGSTTSKKFHQQVKPRTFIFRTYFWNSLHFLHQNSSHTKSHSLILSRARLRFYRRTLVAFLDLSGKLITFANNVPKRGEILKDNADSEFSQTKPKTNSEFHNFGGLDENETISVGVQVIVTFPYHCQWG